MKSVVAIIFVLTCAVNAQNDDPGEPLFLTPLIQAGDITQAQEAARVTEFHPEITSYSGFITVNEEHKSNIFFWYFPAEENPAEAPVMLWNDGGPGISGFFSVFLQNGPFHSSGNSTSLNPHSWHSKYHMIYMDNPVTVGYSFTESEDGYIVSGEEAARDIHLFLLQFFKLFPDLQTNPFYNAGPSFGATYATNAAYYIHVQNQGSPELRINLTGVIIDSPWVDPYSQTDYGDYLYHVGLINEESRTYFKEKETEIKTLLEQENYLDAFQANMQLTQVYTANVTGFYGALSNVYNEQYLSDFDKTALVTINSTRRALHVGTTNFSYVNPQQQSRMHPHFMKSSKTQLEALLQNGYRLLIYIGNMDGTTGNIGIQNLLKTLTWEGTSDLITGPRSIYKVDEKVVGYVKSAGNNATLVLFRNAGHGCLSEQPKAVLEIVNKFIDGTISKL